MGFWPLLTVSGSELLASRSGNQYAGYAKGDRITIHEKVLDVTFADFFGTPTTTLFLEDGNPDVTTAILVRGDARGVVTAGDVIWAGAVLQSYLGAQYWEVATPGDVHPSWPVDAVFYGTMAAGVAILAYAALRKS